MKPEITVYVRSDKVLVGEKMVEELYPVKRATRGYEYSRDTIFQVKLKKEYAYFLPDDQKALIASLKQLTETRGLELRVVDVAKETVVYRLWKRLWGIRSFPLIETRQGVKLKAPFSLHDLERCVS